MKEKGKTIGPADLAEWQVYFKIKGSSCYSLCQK